jgi:hypothetical protein
MCVRLSRLYVWRFDGQVVFNSNPFVALEYDNRITSVARVHHKATKHFGHWWLQVNQIKMLAQACWALQKSALPKYIVVVVVDIS